MSFFYHSFYSITSSNNHVLRRFLFLVSILAFTISGCGIKIPHRLSPDFYEDYPMTIAIMPIDHGHNDAKEFFTSIIYDKLREKGYKPIIVDEMVVYSKKDNIRKEGRLKEISSSLKADALLFTTIEKWRKKNLKVYLSMEVGARFELYDGKTGRSLWESHNAIDDHKIEIDQEVIHLAAHRSLKPYVQRVVDISFSTLPDYPEKGINEGEEKFYYWLKDEK